MRHLTRLLLVLGFAINVLLLGTILAPASVAAVNYNQDVCQQPRTGTSSVCEVNQTENPIAGPNGILTRAIKILSYVAGIAAVIMIMIAGIRYIISGGESASVAGAKDAIIYAVIGLAVVVLSQSIVIFVLNKL